MLLRAPESWPQPLVAGVAMVLLAVLDLGGSLAAKEAVERRSPGLAALGAGLFLAVFWVYISSLRVAELSVVTFGWIVILQVGVVMLDRYRYGVIPARGAWLAIVILLAAQAYLVLAPAATPAPVASAEQHQLSEQGIESMRDQAAELGQAENADGDPADQQRLADGLVPRVVHLSSLEDVAAPTVPTTQE